MPGVTLDQAPPTAERAIRHGALVSVEVLRPRRPLLPLDCTLQEAVRAIGQLGGFMGTTKKTPGWRLLWAGFQALLEAERAFVAGIRHHQREVLRRDRKEFGER